MQNFTMNTEHLNLADWEGRWYIVLTNFPMWLKGDKTSPSLNYTAQARGGIMGLRDEVLSWKNGKQTTILGFDTPEGADNRRFVWRGRGILSLLTSVWELVYIDSTRHWAIIHFEKTLFTPEGYDVVCRAKQLSPKELAAVQVKLAEIGIIERLQPIRQE